MNNITNEQLDGLIKSAVNSSGPLPPDEKFSQIISALHELRELRAAMLQGGNSPVIPDGWVACSERMPNKLIPVMVAYADGEMWSAIWTGTKWDDGTEFPDPHAVTHWQEMPAAPQQEA